VILTYALFYHTFRRRILHEACALIFFVLRCYCWAILSGGRFSELRPIYQGCRALTFALARLSCFHRGCVACSRVARNLCWRGEKRSVEGAQIEKPKDQGGVRSRLGVCLVVSSPVPAGSLRGTTPIKSSFGSY